MPKKKDPHEVLKGVRDILYPPEDPEKAWDPDTIEEVARLVSDYFAED